MSRGLKYDGSIMDIHKLYDLDEVAAGWPSSHRGGTRWVKIFCLQSTRTQAAHYLNSTDGRGPLYPFWVPYQLCTLRRQGHARYRGQCRPGRWEDDVEVCAVAKRDLAAGEVLGRVRACIRPTARR